MWPLDKYRLNTRTPAQVLPVSVVTSASSLATSAGLAVETDLYVIEDDARGYREAIPLVAADVGALVAKFVQQQKRTWLSEHFVSCMAITSTSAHISQLMMRSRRVLTEFMLQVARRRVPSGVSSIGFTLRQQHLDGCRTLVRSG